MNRFKLYAKYYDLLYKDKSYVDEVNYLLRIIKNYNSSSELALLELGCGTGEHARIFSEKGLYVEGIDLSDNMIQIATEKNKNNSKAKFFKGDITSYRSQLKFDVVTSLFHVMSYQDTNAKIDATLETVKYHLKPNGIFIFDFWYGPGVFTDPPIERTKTMENHMITVNRKAIPSHRINENLVEVHFDILITEKASKNQEKIEEAHTMRYFFIPEFQYMLDKHKLKLMDYYHWMSFEKPDATSWNAVIIAQMED